MAEQQLHAVTGAFGYSGRYIAERLLAKGHRVRTLTGSPDRPNPLQGRVEAFPYSFDEPDKLAEALKGAEALYNTYWVRFNAADFLHSVAVENTLRLFEAAERAGVRRLVHTSITNPSEESPLEYFSGKAKLEKALAGSGLSHAILRPTVIFGKEDILVNNIAWVLRRLPVFGVFGKGDYRLQPIYVEDFARLAVEQGVAGENRVIDAIGPETFTYGGLVKIIGRAIGKTRPMISVSPGLGYGIARILGWMVGDLMITRHEIEGLMQGLLYTESPPAGDTRLSEWVVAHAPCLGLHYASELSRRLDRTRSYTPGVAKKPGG